MSHKLRIGDLTIGGNGINNPVPLTIDNYDLSAEELKMTFRQMNVIAYSTVVLTNLYVTGLVVVDPETGQPMTGQNDYCYMPCPPFCNLA